MRAEFGGFENMDTECYESPHHPYSSLFSLWSGDSAILRIKEKDGELKKIKDLKQSFWKTREAPD